MNGVHDLGGTDGFGPIDPEPNEPVFHAEWERRAFALTVAMGFSGAWNIDMSRHARERMDPVDYLRSGYYEKWLHGLETLLVERGLITAEELATGRPGAQGRPARVLKAADVADTLRKGDSARVAADVAPKFKPGDRVVVRNLNPRGHVRAPRYVRCKQGVIARDHGVFIFPDTHAAGLGEKPQHVYSVRFAGREVWGPDAPANEAICVDLWDDYLDPA